MQPYHAIGHVVANSSRATIILSNSAKLKRVGLVTSVNSQSLVQ